ncbi:hypothetical protein QTO34_013347 [Cnephaeus nilssonii]|uniref:Uncharacterized protein n=1 Tax=Cnephaeus nilssonii TaxID=3371016 RepID=A0AA40I7U5_CNENI|nr:hypothetical protein QTO34_013347 [Eptesicus nilssonii]
MSTICVLTHRLAHGKELLVSMRLGCPSHPADPLQQFGAIHVCCPLEAQPSSSHLTYFLWEDECPNPTAYSCPAPTAFSDLPSSGNLLSVASCSWHLESTAQMYQKLVETLGTLLPDSEPSLPLPWGPASLHKPQAVHIPCSRRSLCSRCLGKWCWRHSAGSGRALSGREAEPLWPQFQALLMLQWGFLIIFFLNGTLLNLRLLMGLAETITHLAPHNQEEQGHCPWTWACGEVQYPMEAGLRWGVQYILAAHPPFWGQALGPEVLALAMVSPLPPDAEARAGLLHCVVARVQQAASTLRALTMQPVLVQLLDPRHILWCLRPDHAVQPLNMLEELLAGHLRGLELASAVQATCGRTGWRG